MAAMAATQTPWGLARADERTDALRIGLTPVFLDDQVAFLSDWRLYLEARLLHPVRFVQRGTYREIMDLLRTDRLDYAWVCGRP